MISGFIEALKESILKHCFFLGYGFHLFYIFIKQISMSFECTWLQFDKTINKK